MNPTAALLRSRSSRQPRRLPRSRFAARFVLSALALCCLAAVGCSQPPQPELDSALFLDERVPNGRLDEDETIVLTFSEPVELTEAVRRGIRLDPDEHTLGYYEVTQESTPERELTPRQIAIVMRREEDQVDLEGRHGSLDAPRATGLSVNFDVVSIRNREGRALSGKSRVVDLSRKRPKSAQLLSVEWVDVDQTQSVSRGDLVRMEFNGPVHLSDELRSRGGAAPDDLLVLPVDGDRLDDGDERSHIRSRSPTRSDGLERQIEIRLGSRPRLTPYGTFQSRRSTSARSGSPSGVAVLGTRIRPSPWILDDRGHGVADAAALDLGGAIHPFLSIAMPEDLSPSIEFASVLSLPDDRVLIAGGAAYNARGTRTVTREAYLYRYRSADSSAIVDEAQPVPLHIARVGHTATYMNGWDGVPGTEDDFIIVYGGWDESGQAVSDVEILQPNADEPAFRPLAVDVGLTDPDTLYRSHHTAHAIPRRDFMRTSVDSAGRLLLIGGFGLGSRLNGRISVAEVDRELTSFRFFELGLLSRPRAHHQSALISDNGPMSLFIYGGVGSRGPDQSTQSALTIGDPELFVVSDRVDPRPGALPYELDSIRMPEDSVPAGPRFGHRLVLLNEEEAPLLLVGGEPENPYRRRSAYERKFDKKYDFRIAFRLDIDPDRSDAPIVAQPAGELVIARSKAEALLLADGSVLLVGGEEGDLNEKIASRRVERFDPAWDHFESFGQQLNWPRASFGAAPLSENEWLLIGGAREKDSSAEVFRAAY